uniref:Prostaglandin E2 receptor EP4 subtype n=1 Tax=Magallana gigas TaxID=29159 RepID=K1Q300_MAGGI|eukprot:XP_011451921.1 PREDICTED: prostaglandin E2 receptor EP4 subtype [Crassostrea gigas]
MNTSRPHTSTPILTPTAIPSVQDSVPVILLFLFGVFGNLAALIVLCFRSKIHEWRPFYRFVLGLAITDGGGLLISIPISEYQYLSRFKDQLPRPVCEYLAFIYMFTLLSSAMIVCCMSVDRFLATFFPLYYNSTTKGRRANITLTLLWITSALLCILHVFGLGSAKIFYPGSWCFLNFIDTEDTGNAVYAYMYAITGVLIVTLTLLLNLTVIVYFIYKRLTRNFSASPTQSWCDVHVIVFLISIVTVFTSCWSPLIVNILQHVSGATSGVGETELLLVRLSITNSVIDPWIYILFRKEVVAVAVNCARRVCQKVEETQRSCSRSATGSKTQGGGLGSVHINPLAEDP